MNRFRVWCRLMPAIGMLLLSGCERKTNSTPDEDLAFRPLKTIVAAIVLAEKPDALTWWSPEAGDRGYAEAATNFEVRLPEVNEGGKFEIAFTTKAARLDDCAERLTEDGVLALLVEVEHLSIGKFRELLENFPTKTVHLWMPSSKHWLLIGRKHAARIKLSAILELLTREGAFAALAAAEIDSAADLFSSYVGDELSMHAALNWDKDNRSARTEEGLVQPEFFLTQNLEPIKWIFAGDVEPDIAMALHRRVIEVREARLSMVKGDMLSRTAAGLDEAYVQWAQAAAKNPKDPLILERRHRLAINALTFEKVGNFADAARAYETMIVLRHNDAEAILRYATCLDLLGKQAQAAAMKKRALELRKGKQ